MDFVDARSESVGKVWAAGMLSITYPHGSARIGPQDASIKSIGYSDNLAYKNTSCLFACRLLEANKYAPVFSLCGSRNVPMRTSHPSGSRLLKLSHWKSASAPGSFGPHKIIGAKPCPVVFHNKFNGSPSKRTRPGVAQGLGVSACTYSIQSDF